MMGNLKIELFWGFEKIDSTTVNMCWQLGYAHMVVLSSYPLTKNIVSEDRSNEYNFPYLIVESHLSQKT